MEPRRFSKAPLLTPEEKEKKAEAFLNRVENEVRKEPIKAPRLQKEPFKPLCLRVPESLWVDLHEIMTLTGLSMNAICLESIRPAIKKKLREIKEE